MLEARDFLPRAWRFLMASIDSGGQPGKRRALDHDVPLVPFIDLLLCCIMFLLATAVWEEIARIEAQQETNAPDGDPSPAVSLILSISPDGYVLADTTGVRREIDKRDGVFDVMQLQIALRERRVLEPDRRALSVTAEDLVPYDAVVMAMDTARGEGYPELTLSP
jgi:biopolymer transport protein ExbD